MPGGRGWLGASTALGEDTATRQAGRPPASGRAVRSDVQALRAVAVAAVVIYHLWPHRLRGGFVGVDVFFVISGYLITGQLATELARTGRVSLASFWARRIRRLLPAAFVVLGVSTALLVLFMPVVTWRQNLQEVRAAAAYVENWLLGAHAVDYLAAENSASLVQHYWSLSVEEQFYLSWPLLLVLAAGLTRALRRPRWQPVALCVLATLTGASLAFSVWFTAGNATMAFFATPARAWEFGVGGLLALVVSDRDGSRADALRGPTAWLGFGLIAYSATTITGVDGFPGAVALLPVTGAALVLAAGDPRGRWSPGPVARLRSVQWVGDHSYSVYLWHWPLVIVAPWALHGPMSTGSRALVAVGSLGLAWITKRYVEDPVRLGRRWRRHSWPAYGLAVAGVLVAFAGTALPAVRVDRVDAAVRARLAQEEQSNAPVAATPDARPDADSHTGPDAGTGADAGGQPARRADRPGREQPETAVAPRSCDGAAAMDPVNRCRRPFARPADLDPTFAAADGRGYTCLQSPSAAVPQPCELGTTTSPRRTIALVGNSHAARLAPALDRYGRQHGWRVLVAAKVDCTGLATKPVASQPANDPCVRWSAALQRRLLDMPHLDAVVFASHIGARAYLTGNDASGSTVAQARHRVLDTWSALTRRGVRVIVTEDVPGMRPDSDPECIARSQDRYDPCSVDRGSVVRSNLLTGLAQQNPRLARYVPLTRFFCDAKRCHGLIGGVIVYYDAHHITTTYSHSLAPYLGSEIAAALPPLRR